MDIIRKDKNHIVYNEKNDHIGPDYLQRDHGVSQAAAIYKQ